MAPSAKLKRAAKSKAAVPPTPAAAPSSAVLATNPEPTIEDETLSKAVEKPIVSQPVFSEQILKASRALLKFHETQASSSSSSFATSGKPNLLDEDGATTGNYGIYDSELVWLVVTTKKNISDKKEIKPKPVKIPHPLLNPETTSALLLVKDPQRVFKDILLPSSPTARKVLGLSKLRSKFKTYESRRQLRDTHDLILADERIIPSLRTVLGSTFLQTGTKIPIPVKISKKDGRPANQEVIEKEIKRAVEATYIHLTQTNSTNIRIGLVKHSAGQLAENAMALIDNMITQKKVVKSGWEGVRGVYIKTGSSAALPLYLAPKLYDEDKDTITEEKRQEEKESAEQKKKEREERKKAKKAKQLEAKKGISTATRATEANGTAAVESARPVGKKRKADGDENPEEVKDQVKGTPKSKKQKVLVVGNEKANDAEKNVQNKPNTPAKEGAETIPKPQGPKGPKGGKKKPEATADPKEAAPAVSPAVLGKGAKKTKASAPEISVDDKAVVKQELKKDEKEKEKSTTKKGKDTKKVKENNDKGDKAETKKEEPARRSKRVGATAKA